MFSDVEPQSSGGVTPATLGDMPATLSSTPTPTCKHPSSEALSDLLEIKAAISDPSDAEHPSSLIESSGSDQYSVCIVFAFMTPH